MIQIKLQGEPRGKGRPRSRVAWTKDDKPFVAVYTDAETRHYETSLAWAAKVAMRGRPPLEGPVVLHVRADFSVPKSWTRRERDAALAGTIRPTSKPDFDNVLKMVDALKGIVFKDDTQVVDGRIEKFYSEHACLTVVVDELPIWTVESDQQQMSLV